LARLTCCFAAGSPVTCADIVPKSSIFKSSLLFSSLRTAVNG
jgi:hypothetical protein